MRLCHEIFLYICVRKIKYWKLLISMINKESQFDLIAEYYSRHYEELLNFVANRMQFNNDIAKDIVQNVFVRLMKMSDMITAATLPNLTYTIARNQIFDYWRHKQHVEEYEHRIFSMTNTEDTETVYSAVEMNEILERGIARLSDKQKCVYRMNIYEGKQVRDISEELGLNYKTVENQLGSARKEVRKYVKRMLA